MTPLKNVLTRREALKTVALGALALPILGSVVTRAAVAPAKADSSTGGREHGLRLGVATYSTRMMSTDETIATLQVLRIANAGVYKAHCNWETASLEECRAVAQKFSAAGIAITGSGVINLTNEEAKARKAFENVKAAGMTTMVCKPSLDALPLVEKLAKEYDQKLAIHNHGPEDKVFPSPHAVWAAIKSLDSRIGFCIDVGHALRGRADPAATIRQYAARVYDIHMKDTQAVAGAEKDIPVEIGAGGLDIRGVLKALLDIKYTGVVSLEYEKVTGNPVTGLAESLGYVRGMLATMS